MANAGYERPQLSGTEQKAVDVALVILRKDAADATEANRNAVRSIPVLLNQSYRDGIERLRSDAARLSEALHDYHRLVMAQSNEQSARDALAHVLHHGTSRNSVRVDR